MVRKVLLVLAALAVSGLSWAHFPTWLNERERAALFDAHRTAVMSKLAAVERLRARVAALDPVTEDALVQGAHPPVMAAYGRRAEANAAVAYQDDLADLSRLGEAAPHYNQRINQAALLVDCARLMRLGVYGTHEPQNVILDLARADLQDCEKLEYVFVLRTRRFEGLDFSGDVLAFEIDTGRHLGGFRLDFKAEPGMDLVKDTTTRVEQTGRGKRVRSQSTVTTTERLVRNDFGAVRRELDVRIEQNLRQLMPGLRWLD